MSPTTLSLRHNPSRDTHPCSGCAARFVPSEDSGSRVLSVRGETSFNALLCGGCASKWAHGAVLTLKGTLPA